MIDGTSNLLFFCVIMFLSCWMQWYATVMCIRFIFFFLRLFSPRNHDSIFFRVSIIFFYHLFTIANLTIGYWIIIFGTIGVILSWYSRNWRTLK